MNAVSKEIVERVKYFRTDGYFVQGMDSCCFVYAAANMAVYLDKDIPDLFPIIEQTNAWNGGVIGEREVIEYFGLEMERFDTHRHRPVLDRGGILSIMHPCCNGHCMFVAPIDSPSTAAKALLSVNSFLGPVIDKTWPKNLKPFLPATCGVKMGHQWAATGKDAVEIEARRKREVCRSGAKALFDKGDRVEQLARKYKKAAKKVAKKGKKVRNGYSVVEALNRAKSDEFERRWK